MNNKAFREPDIPVELQLTRDAETFLRGVRERESETEIVKRKFEGEYLTKLNERGGVFKQIIFKNCKLIGCGFDEASFFDVVFENCDFSNSSFSDACFKNCMFLECRAVSADFYGSSFRHVSFEKCNIEDAGFDAVRMSYVKAEDTDFSEASFSKCNITNVEWKKTSFRKASFFKTLLRGIDFTQCDVEGIVISDGKEELKGAVVNQEQAVEFAKRLGLVIK